MNKYENLIACNKFVCKVQSQQSRNGKKREIIWNVEIFEIILWLKHVNVGNKSVHEVDIELLAFLNNVFQINLLAILTIIKLIIQFNYGNKYDKCLSIWCKEDKEQKIYEFCIRDKFTILK